MKKKLLCMLLTLSMCAGLLPMTAVAAECTHHTAHTADCGYREAQEGSDCTHEHDAACYTCTHEHDDACGYIEGEEGAACTHECGEDCLTLACTHEHDEDCGYSEGIEASPCTFVCTECAAEEPAEEPEEKPTEPIYIKLPPISADDPGIMLLSETETTSADWSLVSDVSDVAATEGAYEWNKRVAQKSFGKAFYEMLEEATDGDGTDDYLMENSYFELTQSSSVSDPISILKYSGGSWDVGLKIAEITLNSTDTDKITALIKAMQPYLAKAYFAFDYDHPEVYWLNGTFSVGYSRQTSGDKTIIKLYLVLAGYDSSGDQTSDIRFKNDEPAKGFVSSENKLFVSKDYYTGAGSDITTASEIAGLAKTLAKEITDAFTTKRSDFITYLDKKGNTHGVTVSTTFNDLTDAGKAAYFDYVLAERNGYNSVIKADSTVTSKNDEPIRKSICALIGKSGEDGPVCEGYARALKVLCDAANIDCVLEIGTLDGGDHMWNNVKIGDQWYMMDSTNNDANPDTLPYLLIGSTSRTEKKFTVENILSEANYEYQAAPAIQESDFGFTTTNWAAASTTPTVTKISAVTLSGITAPVTGATPATTATTDTTGVTIADSGKITWYWSDTEFSEAEFLSLAAYKAKVTLTLASGYAWDESVTVTVDGAESTAFDKATNTATITFPETGEGAGTPLTGSVTISGDAKFGEKLTANTNITPEEIPLTYEWYRSTDTDFDPIDGADSSTYTLTKDDIGKKIKVKVGTNYAGYTGTITSTETAEIAKADAPAAPTLTATDPTEKDGKGKINGTTDKMEYSTSADFAAATDCTADSIEVAAGTYYVRVKETETHKPGTAATVEVPAYKDPAKTTLTKDSFTFTDPKPNYTGDSKLTEITSKVTTTVTDAAYTVKVYAEGGTAPLTEVKDAGEYTVKVSITESDKYNAAEFELATVTVEKTTLEPKYLSYDLSSLPCTKDDQLETIKGKVSAGTGITGLDFEVVVCQQDSTMGMVEVDAASKYDVYVKVLGTSKNFNETASDNIGVSLGTIEITALTLSASDFSFTAPTLTYNGTNQIDKITGAITKEPTDAGKITKTVYLRKDGTDTAVTEATDAGTYVIKFTAAGNDYYAKITTPTEIGTVTIAKADAAASFAKANVKVAQDGSVSNPLTIDPAGLTATSWESSNTSAATVDTSGTVTLAAEGKTTITATINDQNYNKVTASYELTVLPAGTEIYTITIGADKGGKVSTTGGEYGSNETVTVTATAEKGYKFVKWMAAESTAAAQTQVSTNAAYSFQPTSNLILTAYFAVDSGSSSSGGGGSSSGGSSSGGSSNASKTETSNNGDGSVTTITTDKNGAVTEKTVYTDGSVMTVETQTDGTTITTEENADGSKKEVTEDADGSVSIHEIAADGTEVRTTIDENGRTTATVSLPENTESKTVTIPTETTPTAGTVVVVVHEDGTREVVKTSVADGNGVAAELPDGAAVEVVDLAKAFSDVNTGDWFKNAIDFVSARGLMNGVSSTTFGSDASLTRGMLAQILHNLEDNPNPDGTKDFRDISDAWYTDAVRWAAENGIVSGYADGSYGPNDPITREQLVTILYRYAQLKGEDISVGESSGMDSFSDADSASDYALIALQWAYENGIVSGNTDGTLDPTGEAERAQVAQMLMNFLVYIAAK